MMVEIKSIFKADVLNDLSDKKTNQIMIAGLVAGVIVDLPIQISWFVYNF